MFWFFAGVLTAIAAGALLLWLFFRNMFTIVNEGKMVANHLEELCKMAVACSDSIVGKTTGLEEQSIINEYDHTNKQVSVIRLYNQGYSVREISKELQLEADQVDLILKLLKQNH